MREIKFRGKRVDNGEWVYGDIIHCTSGKTYIFPSGDYANESDKVNQEGCLMMFTFEVVPKTAGQFTGLKDKNNKEIYEGDIVRTADGSLIATIKIGECYPEPVKYCCELCGVKKHTVYCLHAYDENGEYLIEDNKSLEIIGDMFGNPELLEVINND